jgi:hypothetical protein
MLCSSLSGREKNKKGEGREYEKATVGGLLEEGKPHDAEGAADVCIREDKQIIQKVYGSMHKPMHDTVTVPFRHEGYRRKA